MDFLEDELLNKNGFLWENRYTQSWEILQEDENGTLETSIAALHKDQYISRRKKIAEKIFKRGILRNVCIIMDFSKASNEQDYLPSRGKVVLKGIRKFSKSYFEQNPLSQLGVILTTDGLAEKKSALVGNHKELSSNLEDEIEGKGEASIQNSLELARSMLSHVPNHGTKEIIIVFTGVSSADIGNVQVTIDDLKRQSIKVSCISLAGELFVLKKITSETKGQFDVPMNESHYEDLLQSFVQPPTSLASDKLNLSYMVPMGFPNKALNQTGVEEGYCCCHGKNLVNSGKFSCPRCKSILCQVPADCPVCNLTLITAPYLAKTYHHIFPPADFIAESTNEPYQICRGCQNVCSLSSSLSSSKVGSLTSKCSKCSAIFCADCDIFIHETLFNCPGCLEN